MAFIEATSRNQQTNPSAWKRTPALDDTPARNNFWLIFNENIPYFEVVKIKSVRKEAEEMWCSANRRFRVTKPASNPSVATGGDVRQFSGINLQRSTQRRQDAKKKRRNSFHLILLGVFAPSRGPTKASLYPGHGADLLTSSP